MRVHGVGVTKVEGKFQGRCESDLKQIDLIKLRKAGARSSVPADTARSGGFTNRMSISLYVYVFQGSRRLL